MVEDQRGKEDSRKGDPIYNLLHQRSSGSRRWRSDVLTTVMVDDPTNHEVDGDNDRLTGEESFSKLSRVSHFGNDREANVSRIPLGFTYNAGVPARVNMIPPRTDPTAAKVGAAVMMTFFSHRPVCGAAAGRSCMPTETSSVMTESQQDNSKVDLFTYRQRG